MSSYQESTNTQVGGASSSMSGTLPFYNQGLQSLLQAGQQQALKPYQEYTGNLLAPTTALQQQAYDLAGANVGNYQPLFNQSQQAFQQAQAGAQFDPNQVQQYMNPYMGGVVNELGRLGQEQFQQNVVPTLSNAFGGLGQFGSARQASMLADAAGRSQREILGAQSNALNTGYNNAMNQYRDWSKMGTDVNQQAGAAYGNLGQATQQAGLTDYGALASAGGAQQQQAQKALDVDYAKFQQGQQYPWQQLQNWGNLFTVGTPQANTSISHGSTGVNSSWNTSFKKGGLARFANGGNYVGDAVLDDLIGQGLNRQVSPNDELARRAMEMRQNFMQRAQQAPSLQPLPERGTMDRLGDAMLRASAQGPATIGQAIGRVGAEYLDSGERDTKENQARELKRLEIEGRALPSISGSALSGRGSQPSPEQVRTVYTSARNEGAQMAKDYQFGSAEQRAQWIEAHANRAVQNYLARFATQPVLPRGIGGEPIEPQSIEPTERMSVATDDAPSRPQPGTMAPSVGDELSPVKRNMPEEARRKVFATGGEEMAQKAYAEEIRPAARAAEGMLNTLSAIKQIPRTQDKFAPFRETIGSVFDALGMDSTLAREAQNLQQVRPLLTKIANDRLLMAKGVQTEGDAERAFNEFVKISDTQKAADFMYAWTEELANRAKFKDEVYRKLAQQTGTWAAGDDGWQQSDYAQTVPVALIDGEPWSFTEWRTEFGAKNPNATITDAIEVWNKLSRR